MTTDYLQRIRDAKTRFEAADLIRALACQQTAKLYCYNDTDRVAIAREAENLASSLERNYEDGEPPWRTWLKERGY
jgi:hypothetical protein